MQGRGQGTLHTAQWQQGLKGSCPATLCSMSSTTGPSSASASCIEPPTADAAAVFKNDNGHDLSPPMKHQEIAGAWCTREQLDAWVIGRHLGKGLKWRGELAGSQGILFPVRLLLSTPLASDTGESYAGGLADVQPHHWLLCLQVICSFIHGLSKLIDLSSP